MVCHHCVKALERELTQLGFGILRVGLGYAELDCDVLDERETLLLKEKLSEIGFELIEEPSRKIVEEVKLEIIKHINLEEPCPMNLSQCISQKIGKDYKQISRLFTAMEGRTIEKFYVLAKIEKIKELLSYGDITASEIAYRLGYSSVAFLSRQFKQETGMTPTQYQQSRKDRCSLAEL